MTDVPFPLPDPKQTDVVMIGLGAGFTLAFVPNEGRTAWLLSPENCHTRALEPLELARIGAWSMKAGPGGILK